MTSSVGQAQGDELERLQHASSTSSRSASTCWPSSRSSRRSRARSTSPTSCSRWHDAWARRSGSTAAPSSSPSAAARRCGWWPATRTRASATTWWTSTATPSSARAPDRRDGVHPRRGHRPVAGPGALGARGAQGQVDHRRADHVAGRRHRRDLPAHLPRRPAASPTADVQFCQVVANLTAKALRNAHRFERLRKRKGEDEDARRRGARAGRPARLHAPAARRPTPTARPADEPAARRRRVAGDRPAGGRGAGRC